MPALKPADGEYKVVTNGPKVLTVVAKVVTNEAKVNRTYIFTYSKCPIKPIILTYILRFLRKVLVPLSHVVKNHIFNLKFSKKPTNSL
jgi:hypothetical protein